MPAQADQGWQLQSDLDDLLLYFAVGAFDAATYRTNIDSDIGITLNW